MNGAQWAANPKSQIPNQQISNPQSLIPNPLFSVRTPTAVVTDLGTEFGVEVSKSGATWSHVFQGKIDVRPVGDDSLPSLSGRRARGDGSGCAVRLGVGESARVDRVRGAVEYNASCGRPGRSIGGGGFARQMPRQAAIELFNTGVGGTVGARTGTGNLRPAATTLTLKPQPAVVTSSSRRGIWTTIPRGRMGFRRRSRTSSDAVYMAILPGK